MPTKMTLSRDYKNTLILGLIIAIFLIPTERNLAGQHPIVYIAGLIGFPLLSLLGMWIGKTLFERFQAVFEFVKFGLTGVGNTAINFGVVNTFVLITGVTSGKEVILFTTVAFLCGLANSYYWNSHWSFKNDNPRTVTEFIKYATITVIGLLLNTGIVYTITRFTPPAGISPKLWINIANLVQTLVVMFWNFFGFRLIVFAKQKK